jgi:hypothetical protein
MIHLACFGRESRFTRLSCQAPGAPRTLVRRQVPLLFRVWRPMGTLLAHEASSRRQMLLSLWQRHQFPLSLFEHFSQRLHGREELGGAPLMGFHGASIVSESFAELHNFDITLVSFPELAGLQNDLRCFRVACHGLELNHARSIARGNTLTELR